MEEIPNQIRIMVEWLLAVVVAVVVESVPVVVESISLQSLHQHHTQHIVLARLALLVRLEMVVRIVSGTRLSPVSIQPHLQ
jgi:branched-subunit amino acid ABC-type transport system permease component